MPFWGGCAAERQGFCHQEVCVPCAAPYMMGTNRDKEREISMNFKGLTRTLALVTGMLVAVPYLMIAAIE